MVILHPLTMSTKKTKANGAAGAPVSPALVNETIETVPHTNGNGKASKKTPSLTPTSLDDSINSRELLKVLADMRNGDFSVRMPNDGIGLSGKIYDTLNDIITLNEILVKELTEARKIIGKQGKLNHRVELPRLARR